MILLTKKSVASNILFPAMETSLNVLSDKAAGIATINKTIPSMSETAGREYFPLAVKADTIISYKLKEEVKIANKNKRKKSDKKKKPNSNTANATEKKRT